MGRAARECTEPRRARSGLRGGNGLGVDVAAVDAGLEPAADVLASCEQRVVAHPAGRELHDPHRLVAIPVAARVRGRLVERPQAIVLPPEPCHRGTPTTSRALWEPGPSAGSRSLQTNSFTRGDRASSRACTTTG